MPAWLRALAVGLFGLAVTAALLYGGYLLWEEIPGWTRRTPLADYKALINVVAIFVALSVLDLVFDLGRAIVARIRRGRGAVNG